MDVCRYACMLARTCGCTYVCMHVCMCVCADVCRYECTDVCMNVHAYVSMYLCGYDDCVYVDAMHVGMYICMCVRM